MTNLELNILKRFLKEEGCWPQFYKNTVNRSVWCGGVKEENELRRFSYHIKRFSSIDTALGSAFAWSDTAEGWKYWWQLRDRWRNRIMSSNFNF